jgi:guanine deaminase
MNESIFILKGNIIYSNSIREMVVCEQSYLVSEKGRVKGIYQTLPFEYGGIPVTDYEDRLIIPGLVDLHVHAPQYSYRGLGMDMELLEWLETNTFPEEAKFKNLDYARQSYDIFVENLRKSATTRACIFATVHRQATLMLMDMLEQSGLDTMVGKVNMDRNCPAYIKEVSAEYSAVETVEWIKDVLHKKYKHTRPVLTPRFIPSCTDELMENLKKIQMRYGLPLQSHLSENPSEISWVKELCPWSAFYGDAYDKFGLFGADCPTVMAHCVYSNDEEIKRIKENNVFIAHCPESNMNIASGVAPVRKFIEEGLHVGMGSDVAGGSTESIFTAMAHAIQSSKLRWRMLDDSLKPLTVEEVFYMATKGGGEFFGKVGSFETGYELDAVILDDTRIKHPQPLDLKKRLERMIYFSDDREIYAKYVAGERLF